MVHSIEVDSNNFQREVVDKSYEKTVLVDFFATWCGPCQLLKPLLEKLAIEYDFILAKIDIDKNQTLANQFTVEGVPDVRVVQQGKMMPGLVGALPESQLREFMTKLGLKSELELELERIKQAIAVNNYTEAKHIFDQLFTKYPDNSSLAIAAAKFLIKIDQLHDAEKILATITADKKELYAQAQAVKTLIEFKQIGTNTEEKETELDKKFNQAAQLTLAEDYDSALKLFLEIVQTERKYRNDGARKAMLSIFNLLGMENLITKKYQQELMLALY